MVKRMKQTQNSELRAAQVHIALTKYGSNIDESACKHWKIQHIQPYFPPIEKLFKTDNLENLALYGIKFENEIVSIIDSHTIQTTSGSCKVHCKNTMILSPYKWMRGEYGSVLGLPTSLENASTSMHKLHSANNAAYVGAMISSALSLSGCEHFPKVFGVFNGTCLEHTIDISDDYMELSERPWFSKNIGKLFDIKLSNEIQDSTEFKHTRTARLALQLGENICLEGIQDIVVEKVEDAKMGDLSKVLEDNEDVADNCSDSSSVSTSYVFGVHSCDCSEGDEEEEDDDDESFEPFAWATFKHAPVQTTVMEQCNGTLYELMMMEFDTDKHLAWISQVMFALAYAQHNFAFTHNDLHANNVMYVKTEKEFCYYSSGGVLYRVPTFGYLIKIIDFERGTASIKLAGMKEPKVFMSDHFRLDEEAGGQYNYGEFFHSKYPEIKPNPSFDLVRIATSVYTDLFPTKQSDHLLHTLMKKWLTLEDGSSILFSKENHDRYHGFHLYKAITRFCKDNAIPRKEIMLLKDVYGVQSSNNNSVLMVD
jgi:hypothetical protein